MLQSFCATITPGFTLQWIYDGFRCLCLGLKLLDAMRVCVLNSPIVQGIHIVNHCDIYERFPENCGALPQYPGEALGQ